MKKLITIFSAVLVLSVQNVNAQNCIDPTLIDPSIICFSVYAPVCGCDNVTYDNECIATHWGGVTSYTSGPCSDTEVTCIDSTLINPNVGCMDIYTPVCGCDGITYSNACYATYSGGVTSYIDGPCNPNGDVIAEPCSDLSDVDFGACDMLLGFGVVNGACVFLSGCGWVVDGVDYSPALYADLPSCEDCLSTNPIKAEPCTDVVDVDFGACSMFMGIAIINGACVSLSGCGPIVNGVDYSSSIYDNTDACMACLDNSSTPSFDKPQFRLYPNPASDHLVIEFHEITKLSSVLLLDRSGRVVREFVDFQQDAQFFVLNTTGLRSGLYTLSVLGHDFVKTQRFMLR